MRLIVRFVLLSAILSVPVLLVSGQIEPDSSFLRQAPEPFSLNDWDAVQALWMIRRVGLLLYQNEDERRIVSVESVRAVFVGVDESFPEGHRDRYDLLLNGEPIDWDHLWIEYDGRMRNLRLLYTYRNQRPVPDVDYSLE